MLVLAANYKTLKIANKVFLLIRTAYWYNQYGCLRNCVSYIYNSSNCFGLDSIYYLNLVVITIDGNPFVCSFHKLHLPRYYWPSCIYHEGTSNQPITQENAALYHFHTSIIPTSQTILQLVPSFFVTVFSPHPAFSDTTFFLYSKTIWNNDVSTYKG